MLDWIARFHYERGAYALGYVDDLRDPIEVLLPERGDKNFGDLEGAQARLRSDES